MKRHDMHDRRAILVSASSLLALSGCGSLIGPSEPPAQIYVLSPDLGPMPARGNLPFQLAVARPEASASLASDRIALRRNLAFDYYANAQWTDSAPKLIQTLLVEALEKNGALGFVARDEDGLRADFVVQGELNAFEARYDLGDAPPIVVVDMMMQVVSTVHREIVGARDFHEEAQATANSVTAVITGFDTVLSRLLAETARWILETAQAPLRGKS